MMAGGWRQAATTYPLVSSSGVSEADSVVWVPYSTPHWLLSAKSTLSRQGIQEGYFREVRNGWPFLERQGSQRIGDVGTVTL